jgi:hypothetical protein
VEPAPGERLTASIASSLDLTGQASWNVGEPQAALLPLPPLPGGPALVGDRHPAYQLPNDQDFVKTAINALLTPLEAVTPEDRKLAAEGNKDKAAWIQWQESRVGDNVKILQELETRMPKDQARQELVKSFLASPEAKVRLGEKVASLHEGNPILISINGRDVPFLWRSQTTLGAAGDRARYYSGADLPLDGPLGFKDGMHFLEEFFDNGTSALDITDRKYLGNSPNAAKVAQVGNDLYGYFWGWNGGENKDPSQVVAYLTQQRETLQALVVDDPVLKEKTSRALTVLEAGIDFARKTGHGGTAEFLKSLPGAKEGWYKNGDPTGQPVAIDPVTVPVTNRPRYADIMDHYATSYYEAALKDPRSPTSQLVASWLG